MILCSTSDRPVVEAVREALEWWDESYRLIGAGAAPGPRHEAIIDAARYWVRMVSEGEGLDYEAAFQVMSGDVADQLTADEIREGRKLVAGAVDAAVGVEKETDE